MANATGRVPFSALEDHSLPMWQARPLAANAAPQRGWFTGQNSSGYAVGQDGATPGLLPLGVCDRDVDSPSATAGAAFGKFRWQVVSGYVQSTTGGDFFADADFGQVAWGADNQTIGKKSNLGGSNRSMLGIFLGLNKDGTPYVWTGPLAGLVARAVHTVDSFVFADYQIADAAATTAIAEAAMPSSKVHGTVTAVEFVGAAVTANGTNYGTVTIQKRDGAGGAAVTVATLSTASTSVAAFQPCAFTLTVANCNLLETDILTITTTKAGTGATFTGQIRINGKVI